jgi:serine protease Do
MFGPRILTVSLISLIPLSLQPLLGGQSHSAPKAKSAAVFTTGPRSYLGIGVVDVTDERAKALGLKEPLGVEVTAVQEESPAAKAGLRQGDVILEYNGQPVEGNTQFVRIVQETPAGRKATMQVWRNGSKQSLTATIGSRQDHPFAFGPFPYSPDMPVPPEPPVIPDTPHDMFAWRTAMLGVETEGLNSQLAEYFGVKQGVLVRAVLQGSAAQTAGLKAGDVITKIDGQSVSTPREITPLLRRSGKDVTVTVVRNHKEITLNVKLSRNLSTPHEIQPLLQIFQGFQPHVPEVL